MSTSAERMRLYRLRKKLSSLCQETGCWNDVEPGQTYCPQCAEKRSQKRNKDYHKAYNQVYWSEHKDVINANRRIAN